MMLGETPRNTRGILFVCTGNICRSPYAERRLRQLLPDTGVPISSAGTGAMVGSGIESETSEQLRRLGADVTGFAARAATAQMLDGSELVLTMTRAQRGEVARLHPAAMRRIFALGDFADLCRSSQTWRPIVPTHPWLPQVVTEAAAARGTVAPQEAVDVDVVDPYGRSSKTHTEAFDRIEDFLAVVVAALGTVAGSSRVQTLG
ncbi:low molecular weight phosphatase family protein [Terrabacter sp. LjRoot27]|uniref:arsenate reductase/protein-tyrosine-phosphatase family protein n=1 Tax=Terrabacter sp. LjRoot27 TaxID=3342306 RepID=UPI003ECC62FF